MSWTEGERGIISIEDSVEASIQRLENYIEKCGGWLISDNRNNTENRINGTEITGTKWEEKQLYGRFKRQTSDIRHEITLTWLKKKNLYRETKSLLIAAQNNVVRTNYIKAKIDKTQQNSKCRLFGERDEAINHISEWSKLAEKEYKTRHDWVDKVIH